MAVPSYTTDLTDVIANITSVTGWVALGGGSSGLAFGPDFAMQGVNAVDKQITGAEKGHMYTAAAPIAPAANTHFFVWVFLATPGLADTLANRGLTIAIGNSTTAYNKFHVEGSNTYGAMGRVGKCYPIRYVLTGNASAPYRTLVGTPAGNPQYFGALTNILGTVKGSNLGISAIRYGTGIFVTAGDVSTPATILGIATKNDYNDATNGYNRWGILTSVGGSNYELQGRLVIGQNNAGTATAAYFSDSNRNILIIDTPHSLTDFTQIVIDHASTVFNMTNITVEAVGTNNKGLINFINASTVSSLVGCSFIKIGTTVLRAGVTANGCTWRQTDQITQNGSIITNCTIDKNTGTKALLVDNITRVTNTTFISKGTGYGIEGFSTAGDYSLTNLTFTGFAAGNGSTGNEAIHVLATTGIVNLNITGGSPAPSIRTDGATVNVISGSVTVTITVKTVDGVNIQNAMVLALAAAGGPMPVDATVTITNSSTTATVSHTAHGMATNDKVQIKGASLVANNGVFSITKINNDSYTYTLPSPQGSNPTGTIKATYAVLNGLTDVNGTISTSRVFASSQPITGRVRKSSTSPLYKTSNIVGTISNSTGLATTILLIADE